MKHLTQQELEAIKINPIKLIPLTKNQEAWLQWLEANGNKKCTGELYENATKRSAEQKTKSFEIDKVCALGAGLLSPHIDIIDVDWNEVEYNDLDFIHNKLDLTARGMQTVIVLNDGVVPGTWNDDERNEISEMLIDKYGLEERQYEFQEISTFVRNNKELFFKQYKENNNEKD